MELERGFAMRISRGLVVAKERENVHHIACLMERHNIGAILIMRDEELVGIISERDITRRIVAKKLDPDKILAQDIMTKEIVTGNLQDGLNNIYEILCAAPFRHLPIKDGDKVVGIVSKRDILYSLKPKKNNK